MVNNHGIIIHKVNHKKGRRHDYDIYKENHPLTPKQVVNVVDLRIPWHRKGFSRATIIHYHIERKEICRVILQRKRIQQKSF